MMRVLSLFFSLAFHALILVAGMYASVGNSIHVDLNKRVYTVDLVASSQLQKARAGKRGAVRHKPMAPKEAAAVSRPQPKPRPATDSAKKISAKKSAATPRRVVAKKTEPQKKRSSKEIVARALKGVQDDVGKKRDADQQDLARELAGLRRSVDQDTRAAGQGGTGGQGGSGLLQVYARIAEAAIKEHWRFPRVGRNNLVARVEVRIDPGGRVLETRVLESSGRQDFDDSALRAILEAEPLPEPPSRDIRQLIINFNLSELS